MKKEIVIMVFGSIVLLAVAMLIFYKPTKKTDSVQKSESKPLINSVIDFFIEKRPEPINTDKNEIKPAEADNS